MFNIGDRVFYEDDESNFAGIVQKVDSDTYQVIVELDPEYQDYPLHGVDAGPNQTMIVDSDHLYLEGEV